MAIVNIDFGPESQQIIDAVCALHNWNAQMPVTKLQLFKRVMVRAAKDMAKLHVGRQASRTAEASIDSIVVPDG
jgi:hypothetical protein